MRQRKTRYLGIAALSTAALLLCGWAGSGASQLRGVPVEAQTERPGGHIQQHLGASLLSLPTDPSPTCTVAAATFKGWFHSGAVTQNGVVDPANSVTFSNPLMDCPFYQWSEQMFLWLTSPAPASYGGGAHVFDSPVFLDVSPLDHGVRTFISHVPGTLRVFSVRAAKTNARGNQVLFAADGRTLEVVSPKSDSDAKPLLRNQSGQLVQIGSAALGKNGELVLRDKSGMPIKAATRAAINGRQISPQPPGSPLQVRGFRISNIQVFLDSSGNLVEVEQGQADDGVLEAQNGSLVYYAIMVNDVYAYFLTGTKNGGITPTPTHFPTTAADLAKITTFASQSFPDANALAIEVKTAWVEAAGLSNPGSYITMTATIPTYDKSDPNHWTPNGQKTALLALVGMHVVGSAKGHPEMIWATFEHAGNAPAAGYSYINTLGQTKTVLQNTAGNWLFAANNSAGPFNDVHMQLSAPDILSLTPHTISPSDTLRQKAWGAASDFRPNPLVASAAAANTEILSINNSVNGMLANGDVRANYILIGSTWTAGGAAPSGSFSLVSGGNEVGTSRLANTTLETYEQGSSPLLHSGGMNCFGCHLTNTTSVSNVFPTLKALF